MIKMSMEMLLSIVVPVYNVEKYIDECMKTILDNYKDGVEVVLVDDGSTDSSGDICEKYKEKYSFIKVIHQKNGGLSRARNTGIKHSVGKYIWFVDSDDYISNGSIEMVIDAFKSNADLILGGYYTVTPDGQKKLMDKKEVTVKKDMLPYEYFMKLGNVSYAAWRMIIKRQILIDNDLMFTGGIYHEDEDWTPRMLCKTNSIYVIDCGIYNYRIGNTASIMGMLNPKKVTDKLDISYRMYEDTKKVDDGKADFLKTRVEHMYITALNEYCLYDKNVRKELIKDFKEKKFLLKINNSKKSKFVLYTLNVIGFLNTSKLLRFRNNIK